MTNRALIIVGTTAFLLSAIVAVAQPRRGAGMPRYDKTTETTLTGTVQEIQPHQGRMGGTGTHLLLKAGADTIEVHVGPTNWLVSHKYAFAKGDQLQVTGSKVKIGGADAFIAREIVKDGTTIVLRDAEGIPAWSDGQRGTPPPDGGCGCGCGMRR